MNTELLKAYAKTRADRLDQVRSKIAILNSIIADIEDEATRVYTEVLGNTSFKLHIECGIVQMHHRKCIREDRTVLILDPLHDVYHAVELRVVSDHAEPRKILVAQLYDVSDRNGLREKVIDRTEARLLTALVKRETQRNTVVLQTGSLPVPRKKSAGFETLEVLLQFAGTGQQKTLTFI